MQAIKKAIVIAGVQSLEGGSLESHLPDEVFDMIDALEDTEEIDSYTLRVKDLIRECISEDKIFEKARGMAMEGRV